MTKEELKPVGTKAVVTEENYNFEVGTEIEVVTVDEEDDKETYLFTDGVGYWWMYNDQFNWLEGTKVTTSDGSSTSYYDFPFNDWVTGNDMMEYLAEHKWGKFGIHLKDIFKSTLRWGEKEGTTVEYDTRKIIYYGCRILRMIGGVEEVRKTLQGMLDDPQFSVTQEENPSIDEVVTLEEPAGHKFKVGDKVYVEKAVIVHDDYQGKVGTVEEVSYSPYDTVVYVLKFGSNPQTACEDIDGLILVEPVTYDFDKMLFGEYDMAESKIVGKFDWGSTPQGFGFWDEVDDGLVEESVWKPILADMEMQYEESKK